MTIATGEKMFAADILNLTFFPRGTILTFSTEAYSATSAAFKAIWKICDGQNGTPNLVNKFLRGGAASGATGGADNQTVKVPLRQHNHTFTGNTATGSINADPAAVHQSAFENVSSARGVFSTSVFAQRVGFADFGGNLLSISSLNFSMTPSGAISSAGSRTTDEISVTTVPSYYTVIYIMKVS